MPESKDPDPGPVPDLLGAALLAVSVGALALGLVQAPEWGWASARTLGRTRHRLVTAAVFWRRSRRHIAPVVEPALLAVRTFAWSNATSLLFGIAFAGNLLVSILWMEQVWGYSALRTGLGVAPGPLMVPVFAALAQTVAHRVSVGRIAATGSALLGVSLLLSILLLGEDPSYASEMLPCLLVSGAGVGLALPTILASATADLPPARAATGSAVVNMSRQIGSVLGVSILIALLGTPVGYPALRSAFDDVRWTLAAASLLAAAAAFGMTVRTPAAPEVAAARYRDDRLDPSWRSSPRCRAGWSRGTCCRRPPTRCRDAAGLHDPLPRAGGPGEPISTEVLPDRTAGTSSCRVELRQGGTLLAVAQGLHVRARTGAAATTWPAPGVAADLDAGTPGEGELFTPPLDFVPVSQHLENADARRSAAGRLRRSRRSPGYGSGPARPGGTNSWSSCASARRRPAALGLHPAAGASRAPTVELFCTWRARRQPDWLRIRQRMTWQDPEVAADDAVRHDHRGRLVAEVRQTRCTAPSGVGPARARC